MQQETDKQAEFEKMLREHGDVITKLCFFYADNAAEVADMRQDTLLNLWRGWDSFRGASQLSTWIHRVCLNTCVSYLRRESRHRNNLPFADLAITDAADGTDRAAMWQQLHSLIGKLSTRERAVILLWLEDFTYEQIAEVIGANRNVVATLIFRIKQKLVKLSNQ